jgi:histidinol-phosphate aminotransferase
MSISIRPAIANLPGYRAGKPAPVSSDGISYKLSSNENPYPPLPGVLDAVSKACEQMNRYPDAGNTELTAAVAEKLSVTGAEIAFGAGSVSVLYHLLQAVAGEGDEVIYAWRSFEAYPIAVGVSGAHGVKVGLAPGMVHDLDAIRAAITPATRAILLCTPNNPTGPVIDHDRLSEFLDVVGDDIMVIIDEAYLDFSTASQQARGLELRDRHRNVVLLRTFSKAYGLAGFRVGYCIADPQVAAAVQAATPPFSVSVPAQAAVLASMDAEPALLERVSTLIAERDKVAGQLRDLGFDIPDSQGNFVWLPAGEHTSSYAGTFAAAGLMTRAFPDGGDFDGIRITIGEPEANQLVAEVAATLPR